MYAPLLAEAINIINALLPGWVFFKRNHPTTIPQQGMMPDPSPWDVSRGSEYHPLLQFPGHLCRDLPHLSKIADPGGDLGILSHLWTS